MVDGWGAPFEMDAVKPLDALLCYVRRGWVLLELLVLLSLSAYPPAQLRILGVSSSRHIAASSMHVLVRNQLVEFRVPFSID